MTMKMNNCFSDRFREIYNCVRAPSVFSLQQQMICLMEKCGLKIFAKPLNRKTLNKLVVAQLVWYSKFPINKMHQPRGTD